MRRKSKRHSDGSKAEVFRLYKEGYTFREIEEKLGIADSTCCNWVLQEGKRRIRTKPHYFTRAVLELYAVGHGHVTIARLLHTSHDVVWSILHRMRVSRSYKESVDLREGKKRIPSNQEELLALARGFPDLPSAMQILEESRDD